jgi:DNA polymerase-3 subunit epsilon
MKLPGWLSWGRERDGRPIEAARYVVFDTELTSLDRRSNRMLSIGAIAMQGSGIRLQDQFYRVVNPGVTGPAAGVLIHGLRPADVESGESPARVMEEFAAFVSGAVLVGHFAGIDMSILNKELAATGRAWSNPAICTARVERWILQRQPYSGDIVHRLEHLDLWSLARAYQLEVHDTHHALQDAFLTARLWQRQIHALRAARLDTVGDLLRIAKV